MKCEHRLPFAAFWGAGVCNSFRLCAVAQVRWLNDRCRRKIQSRRARSVLRSMSSRAKRGWAVSSKLDRNCAVEVIEVPDEVPALIGQIPLEMLDLVIDLQGRRLTGNPAHGGEQVLELY